jgi:hypothetical protein
MSECSIAVALFYSKYSLDVVPFGYELGDKQHDLTFSSVVRIFSATPCGSFGVSDSMWPNPNSQAANKSFPQVSHLSHASPVAETTQPSGNTMLMVSVMVARTRMIKINLLSLTSPSDFVVSGPVYHRAIAEVCSRACCTPDALHESQQLQLGELVLSTMEMMQMYNHHTKRAGATQSQIFPFTLRQVAPDVTLGVLKFSEDTASIAVLEA